MLFLRMLLLVVSVGFLVCAAGVVIYDIYLALELGRLLRRGERPKEGAEAGSPEQPTVPQPPLRPAPRLGQPRRQVRWTVAGKLVAADT